MKKIGLATLVLMLFAACNPSTEKKPDDVANISAEVVDQTIELLQKAHTDCDAQLIAKGVKHAASLWRQTDGDEVYFQQFCLDNYLKTHEEKSLVFSKLEHYFETLTGNFTKMGVGLNLNLTLDNGPLHEIDRMFGAYNPSAHLSDDLYTNKIAFVIALNFPYFTLSEKETLGTEWSNKHWAWARLGDQFAARVPAQLKQQYSNANTNADIYISAYNIYMGSLRNAENEQLFTDDMILLSHWNLRDEIKSNYGDAQKGYEKQQMVYQVMKRIIDQSIPREVINSGKYQWNPYENTLFDQDQLVSFTPENTDRYQQIINSFKALQAMDAYYPAMNTYIERSFSGNMEIAQPEVEQLFHEFLSAPQVKKVAELIKARLGRDLQAYDIWYDGFKARSSISADILNNKTQKKYPDAKAFEADMPNMLVKLGWDKERAKFLASKITVQAARGSGHALGAEMHDMYSYLRTRVPETGMNYKGYNIAVHEFGHNVEQTISLHRVPYYMLHGVPNTAFTEALAFIFQSRDLKLLDMNDPNPNKEAQKTLDTFWSIYEIMGVSMVDMKVWKWLYANPNADAEQLKKATLAIANELWNLYYAEVFGLKDEPVLAIYSHMIAYPLYLSAYSFGHLIDFQIEQYLKGKDLATEVERMFSQGRLTPQTWMKRATGHVISNEPILTAVDEALSKIKQ
ncbi:MAG: hypothetical protein CVU09_05120 [Bacteroidetes bacterium HGW-Bacteroidetes-4]|jgi:hypothetical protein|nr:MAG: hypothetical protein CVU09_05120 [Bacteroidetes bacterium HGW-Bacteroidetes-4]